MRWPFARYGTRELVVGTVVLGGAIAWAAWQVPWLVPVPALLLACLLAFFRDPERSPAGDERAVLSPADGRVADIEGVREEEFLDGEALRIGVFMSLVNVHVNRAPVSGRVAYRAYRPGAFHDARSAAASRENERALVGIEAENGTRVLVRQIAGLVARRIVCDCAEGDRLERGRRIGMVKFGSRLEVSVPRAAGFRPAVAVGQRVRAGETVLGTFGEGAEPA